MRVLEARSNQWTTAVDLQDVFFRFTMDSATDFLFGTTIGSQPQGLKQHGNPFVEARKVTNQFTQDFEAAQECLMKGIRLDSFYWLEHTTEFRQYTKRVHDYVDQYI